MIKKPLFFVLVLTLFHLNSKAITRAWHDDTLKSIYADTGIALPPCWIVMEIGQKLPPIFLYDTLGNKVYLESLFKNDKPVIFVNGSYTCHIFRSNISRLNKFLKSKKEKYEIYFIYTQEAHPLTCSPYGDHNNDIHWNHSIGINVEQPVYFHEREFYAKKTMRDLGVELPILIDNEFNDYYTSVFAGPHGYMMFSKDKILLEQRNWFYKMNKRKRNKMKRQTKAIHEAHHKASHENK